ncbi:MAG: alpha/beta fold hydrolase [Flavobacteriaceae bacterium]|nr:alpha/beta fold hydrolase [Flavobacteriaceae bacterium]
MTFKGSGWSCRIQDFLDLDFVFRGSKRIVLVVHGLEGSSGSKYVLSLAQNSSQMGLDVVAINLRGCSGEANRLYASYHSGQTEDLQYVIGHLVKLGYEEVFLTGFSLGGNQVLKFLGTNDLADSVVKAAVGVSVPCDLSGSADQIAKAENQIYLNRFLRSLKAKILEKSERFPEFLLDREQILNIGNFVDFDDFYTAPAHGFADAYDYYQQSSCKQYLKDIHIPCLLINALDDTFLSPSCYPEQEAAKNLYFHLEISRYGGHVGFNSSLAAKRNTWLAKRILHFLLSKNLSAH